MLFTSIVLTSISNILLKSLSGSKLEILESYLQVTSDRKLKIHEVGSLI